jgi:hypothetical protein
MSDPSTTYKYHLPFDDTTLHLPEDAVPLHVARLSDGEMYIWCYITPILPTTARRFQYIATGAPAPEHIKRFVGTVVDGVDGVWHCFEVEV